MGYTGDAIGSKMGGPYPELSVSNPFGMPIRRERKNLAVKTMGFGIRAQIPSLLLINCVSLGKLLNHSEVGIYFPHLQDGDNNGV